MSVVVFEVGFVFVCQCCVFVEVARYSFKVLFGVVASPDFPVFVSFVWFSFEYYFCGGFVCVLCLGVSVDHCLPPLSNRFLLRWYSMTCCRVCIPSCFFSSRIRVFMSSVTLIIIAGIVLLLSEILGYILCITTFLNYLLE